MSVCLQVPEVVLTLDSSVWISVFACLSVHTPTCPSSQLCFFLSVTFCMSICVPLSVFVSLCLSVCLSLRLCLSVCLSVSSSLSVSLSLSVSVSLCLSVCLALSLSPTCFDSENTNCPTMVNGPRDSCIHSFIHPFTQSLIDWLIYLLADSSRLIDLPINQSINRWRKLKSCEILMKSDKWQSLVSISRIKCYSLGIPFGHSVSMFFSVLCAYFSMFSLDW